MNVLKSGTEIEEAGQTAGISMKAYSISFAPRDPFLKYAECVFSPWLKRFPPLQKYQSCLFTEGTCSLFHASHDDRLGLARERARGLLPSARTGA